MLQLTDLINECDAFIKENAVNRIPNLGMIQVFNTPVIGIASADNPLFEDLKNPDVIGAHHMNPGWWLQEAKSVISFFLPFRKEICEPNYTAGEPAKEWLYGKIQGEICIEALSDYIINLITRLGFKAMSPKKDRRFGLEGTKSNWSERHVAFIAGLGTFGLSKSFITEKGCAGRIGSVLTDLKITPANHFYKETYENCSFCGECINRCPVQAIDQNGKDDFKCSKFLKTIKMPIQIYGTACGKCQTKVPCSFGIPGIKLVSLNNRQE